MKFQCQKNVKNGWLAMDACAKNNAEKKRHIFKEVVQFNETFSNAGDWPYNFSVNEYADYILKTHVLA